MSRFYGRHGAAVLPRRLERDVWFLPRLSEQLAVDQQQWQTRLSEVVVLSSSCVRLGLTHTRSFDLEAKLLEEKRARESFVSDQEAGGCVRWLAGDPGDRRGATEEKRLPDA
jgi:hypothetical protein